MKKGLVIFISLISVLPLLHSCATREELARREKLHTLSSEMDTSQKSMADVLIRIGDIEERVGLVAGKVEETAHRERMNTQSEREKMSQSLALLREEMDITKKKLSEQTEINKSIMAKLESQSKYLEEVLSTLASISGKKNTVSKSSTKSSSPYDEAMSYFDKGQYKTAKPLLIELLENKKINNSNKAKILHRLGMIDYSEKQFENSLTWFSRLVTEYSSSSFAPHGLLFLGKSFDRMKKQEEAKQAWNELLTRYPKSKHAATAKNLLKGQ